MATNGKRPKREFSQPRDPAEFDAFALWLLSEEDDRDDINTIEEYALDSGIPISTLYFWRTKLTEPSKKQDTDKFVARIYSLAMQGKSAKHAELYSHIIGLIGRKAVEKDAQSTLTSSDIFRLQQRAEKELFEAGYTDNIHLCARCQQEIGIIPQTGQDLADKINALSQPPIVAEVEDYLKGKSSKEQSSPS